MTNQQSPPLNFTGSIPANYDQYLGPMFFEDYAIDICNRIDTTRLTSVLELCCGTGRVTRHLRETLLPSTTLVASDLSPDMLTVAKAQLPESNIDWQIIDAQQIPFQADAFDLVVCCFGFMLVPDRAKAFAEALRVLRPGGVLLMSTWDTLEHNAASFVFRNIIKEQLGDSLPESYRLPFALNNPATVKEELLAAGFSHVQVEVVEKQSRCATAKVAAYGLVHGGSLYNEIVKHGPEQVNKILELVEKELARQFGQAPMIAPIRALITEAKK
jgi:ubiquinone/menaquinone biosynthesis C-methylase UbiE